MAAEDNFNELSSLRPVVDSYGEPVMSSGNFAVVFKMRDENDGKLYAVKCFIKDQEGRDESYRKIADELEVISSSYILPLRYLENELFVDSAQCSNEEFPVVVMEWVEGETLDAYLKRNLNDKYELEMLSYRFNRMAAWLLAQPFAHGDLKPDNILVRNDGSLVLVDYDGMYVPTMKGEKAREIGSPDYRHPSSTDSDFDEHIDDFSIAVIALSLKALSLNPQLKPTSTDSLLFSQKDYQNPSNSEVIKAIQLLMDNPELVLLYGAFSIALVKNSLDLISFRLFMTGRPSEPKAPKQKNIENLSTKVSRQDIEDGITDEYGVIYSKDGKRLLKCYRYSSVTEYRIKLDTEVICDCAFSRCSSLQSVTIPNSVTSIGIRAFNGCSSLQSVTIPNSVSSIGDWAFSRCSSLQSVTIPNSVASIGESAFDECSLLQSVTIPNSVASIGDGAFFKCSSLHSVTIPNSVTSIGNWAFYGCSSLQSVTIPNSVSSIGNNPFTGCHKLRVIVSNNSNFHIVNKLLIDNKGQLISCLDNSQFVTIPNSVTSIGDWAFYGCSSLQSVTIPNSVTSIGDSAFAECSSLQSIIIPNSVTSISARAFPHSCKVIRK